MEAITQKHEDSHVTMLSDMFTAIPPSTIRRYLRENGGDMERCAAALIEVNEKYVSELAKKQQLTASQQKNLPPPAPVSNPNAAPPHNTSPRGTKEALEKALQEKEREIAQVTLAVSKVDESLAKNFKSPNSDSNPSNNNNNNNKNTQNDNNAINNNLNNTDNKKNNDENKSGTGIAQNVMALQRDLESSITPSHSEKEKSQEARIPFDAWKADRLSESPSAAKKPVESSDLAQSLARSVVGAPSPSKILSTSSLLASVLSEENSAIERIQSQLTSAYQRVFTEVEQKLAVQTEEIDRLKAALEEKDAALTQKDASLTSLEAKLKEAEVQLKSQGDHLVTREGEVKALEEKLKAANETIENLKKQPVTIEDQIKASAKKVAESIQGTFDKSVAIALNSEGAVNASLEVNRIANAIKKEIAIAFLKELNASRKNGDETANLSMSSLGISSLNSAPKPSSSPSPPSYASALLNGNKQ